MCMCGCVYGWREGVIVAFYCFCQKSGFFEGGCYSGGDDRWSVFTFELIGIIKFEGVEGGMEAMNRREEERSTSGVLFKFRHGFWIWSASSSSRVNSSSRRDCMAVWRE